MSRFYNTHTRPDGHDHELHYQPTPRTWQSGETHDSAQSHAQSGRQDNEQRSRCHNVRHAQDQRPQDIRTGITDTFTAWKSASLSSSETILNATKSSALENDHKPHQGTARTTPVADTLEHWPLIRVLDPYTSPTPCEALVVLDILRRPLCASKEMAQLLGSLEDMQWPERTYVGKIKNVITLSKNGRWAALVACTDEEAAKGIKAAIGQQSDLLLAAEFLEQEALEEMPGSREGWKLQEGIRLAILQHGISIDSHHCSASDRHESLATQVLPIEATPKPEQRKIFTVPGSVAKDHRKAPVVHSNKKLASHISHWNAQQSELRKENAERGEQDQRIVADEKVELKEKVGDAQHSAPAFDYTDEDKKACLLCQRQFKSVDVLRRHTLESDLHRRNLQDEQTRAEGQQRKLGGRTVEKQPTEKTSSQMMKRAAFTSIGSTSNTDTPSAGETSSAYRDRALERRVVFGMERVGKKNATQGQKRKGEEASVVVDASRNESSLDTMHDSSTTKLDESSVGGALLAKMGWTSGQGLGAKRQGRTSPVEAFVYEPGAGLGSSGGGVRPPALTAAEYGAKRARFVSGGYDDASRLERMRERYGHDLRQL